MKFNANQKKWAMTGVLLAVLGFNISPPKSMVGFSMADLASEKENIKNGSFEFDGSEYLTEFEKQGNRTSVRIDKVEFTSESGSKVLCGTCSTTYVFDKNFQTNTTELNDIAIELVAASRKSKKEEASDRGSARVKATKKDKAEKEEKAASKKSKSDSKDKYAKLNKELTALSESCGDNDDKDEKMSCYSEGLTNLFSDLDSDEINDSTVLSFISRRVMPVQADIILENRKALYDFLAGKSAQEPKLVKELLYPLENLIAAIPEGHSKLQQSLINSSASIKAADRKFISELNQKASSTVGAEKSAYLQEIQWRTQMNMQLDTDLTEMSQRIAIVTDGMQQANKFSAGLQQSLAQAFASTYTPGASDTVVINGQTYRRTDSMGRGGTNGTGIATIPSQVPSNVIQGTYQSSGMPAQFIPAQPGNSTMMPIPQQQQMYTQPDSLYQPQQHQYQPQGAAPVGTGRTSGMLRQ